MIVPRMAESIGEWEAHSIPQQERLLRKVRDEPHDVLTLEPPEEMTAEQERVFHQQVEAMRRQGKPATEVQRVAQAYAKAMERYR